MNANGKKTGFRVAALFAVAGASMAMAAGSSPSGEAVAYDQVVMVSKDAPSQQMSDDTGGGDRALFDDSFIGDGFIGGSVLGGEFLGGVVNGGITGDGGIAGNTNGNSLGNQTGD
ncbi:hypothetical protein [Melittangium boletus]|uniref:hypothetical protein n=1 Tax=Melittangium boletus TaxID=83453 RepID=UPI003DA6762B